MWAGGGEKAGGDGGWNAAATMPALAPSSALPVAEEVGTGTEAGGAEDELSP